MAGPPVRAAVPRARAAAFLVGGTGGVVIATMSFLGVYQHVLFSDRAVQTVLLLLAAPLFLAAQLIQMIREDEQEAAQVDAELNARAATAAVPGGGEADTAPAATTDSRPWWESDSRFTGRFGRPGSE